jgi:hypothetical protein
VDGMSVDRQVARSSESKHYIRCEGQESSCQEMKEIQRASVTPR